MLSAKILLYSAHTHWNYIDRVCVKMERPRPKPESDVDAVPSLQ